MLLNNRKPKVEVKADQTVDAGKKIEAAKEHWLDTDKYNQARLCLTDTKICTDIKNPEEYSRAWNNLAAAGCSCPLFMSGMHRSVSAP